MARPGALDDLDTNTPVCNMRQQVHTQTHNAMLVLIEPFDMDGIFLTSIEEKQKEGSF